MSSGKIYQAIPAIMAKVGTLAKAARNAEQKYDYRAVDAIFNRLHGLFVEQGVFCIPQVLEQQVAVLEDPPDQYGKVKRKCHAVLKVRYIIAADDGSSVEVTTTGEGMDHSDKACNKAMQFAFKYAMSQLFCIPYGVDGDAESPDMDQDAPAPAAVANEAIKAKAKDNPGWEAFVTTADELAERDLDGWKLSHQDRITIAHAVREISGKTTALEAAEWLRNNGSLELIPNGDGSITGVAVIERQQVA